MFDFQQKRKMRTVFGSRVTQGILVVLTSLVFLSSYNRYLIARDMAERREVAESEIKDLEERRRTLEAEVKYLSNDRGIEAEMRRQFDIARDGEQVVIILDDEEKPTSTKDIMDNAPAPKRAWYRFW
jgi:cell division protein FtsB